MTALDVKHFRVAHAVGVSDGHLSHLLRGERTATDEMLDRIETAIGEIATAAGREVELDAVASDG